MIINVNEKRVLSTLYPLTRISTCCVLLNTTDFTPDTYRMKRDSGLFEAGPIVTLPFSVLLPNQTTGSISLLINFPKATCLVLCAQLRGGYLESWFSQNCWPVFWFIDVSSGWVWFNPLPSPSLFFLTHLRSCYQAVVSLKSNTLWISRICRWRNAMKEEMEMACFWNDYALCMFICDQAMFGFLLRIFSRKF